MTNTLLKKLPLTLRSPRSGEQASIINPKAIAFWIGHILGDGYISSSKGYLQIDQASLKLSQFFHKLLKSFKMLPVNSQIQTQTREDKRYNTTNTSYRFATRAYKVNNWVDAFYKVGKNNKKTKTIPNNIGELLIDGFSVAIWFLGDGWFDGDNVCFAAGSLDNNELLLLQQCLFDNFGIETSLVGLDPLKNNGRKFHRITVKACSYTKFYNLVESTLQEFVADFGEFKADPLLKRKFLPKPSKNLTP